MAGRRDYKAEYRRRQQRARQFGFPSYSAQRRAPRRLTGPGDFGRLPEAARESRSEAFRVVAFARRQQTTVEAAARELEVPVSTVRYWAPEALEPRRGGLTLPREADRLLRLRPLLLEGEREVTFVAVRGSRAADRADEVFNLQWQYVTGKADAADLERVRGVRIAGRTVETDPDRLGYLARAGAIDIPEAYRSIVG
jgi:transposase-like protein